MCFVIKLERGRFSQLTYRNVSVEKEEISIDRSDVCVDISLTMTTVAAVIPGSFLYILRMVQEKNGSSSTVVREVC